jgi:hypothetical protein
VEDNLGVDPRGVMLHRRAVEETDRQKATSLEVARRCSYRQSGRRDLNPRPPEPHSAQGRSQNLQKVGLQRETERRCPRMPRDISYCARLTAHRRQAEFPWHIDLAQCGSMHDAPGAHNECMPESSHVPDSVGLRYEPEPNQHALEE